MSALIHCRRDVSVPTSYVDLTSQFLSVVSEDATNNCSGGAIVDCIKAFDGGLDRKVGFQYPFSLTPMQFERLIQKPSLSVLGRINMCTMLQTLLIRLSGLLDER